MATQQNGRSLASLSRLLLFGLWLAASIGMIGQRLRDISAVEPLGGIGLAAGLLYILVLIWHLIQQRPAAADLPDLAPLVWPRRSFRGMLWTIIGLIVVLFAVAIIAHPALVFLALLTLLSLWLLVAWRQQLSVRLGLTGAGISAGLIVLQVGVGKADGFMLSYLACLAPLFMAGVLLARQSSLSRSWLGDKRYAAALRSFAWGALLGLPPALLNIFWGPQAGDVVDQGWKALAALTPAFAEEIWARLALTTLIYTLLRPTTNDRPRRAVAWAVLIAAMVHAQAHSSTQALLGPAFVMNTLNALLYGVPLGLLFAKRDLEHAVGYHFAVDFVRFLAAWLWR